jgi:hypothetical protein
MTPEEIKFWIDSAKKEHFFTSDRDIKYVEENGWGGTEGIEWAIKKLEQIDNQK